MIDKPLRQVFATFTLLVLVTLSAVGFAQDPVQGGTLHVAVATEPPSLDPFGPAGIAGHRFTVLLYENLVRLTPDMAIEPWLAESWETPDDRTYVFHLRDDVVWHNGDPFTAANVKAVVEYIQNPETAASGRGDLTVIESIEVQDPHTIVFHLNRPAGGLLGALSYPWTSIVHPSLLEDPETMNQIAIGTGPFRLDEWRRGAQLRLVRNEAYYRSGIPRLDEVLVQVVPDESSIIASLRAGNLDLTLLTDNTRADSIAEDAGLEVIAGEQLGYWFLVVNNSVPPFDNLLVRQALSYAIDRDEVLLVAAEGNADLTGPLPPAMGEWTVPVSEYASFTRNVERARELLAEAGFPNGVSAQFTYIAGYPLMEPIAATIQAHAAEAGIQLVLQPVDYSIWLNRLNVERDMPLTINLLSGFADPDAWLYNRFHSEGYNQANWNQPEVEALLEEGKSTTDRAGRIEVYKDLQRLLVERVPYIWLFTPHQIHVAQDELRGFVQHPTTFYYGLDEAWLEQGN